jgi:hypothetical protein
VERKGLYEIWLWMVKKWQRGDWEAEEVGPFSRQHFAPTKPVFMLG